MRQPSSTPRAASTTARASSSIARAISSTRSAIAAQMQNAQDLSSPLGKIHRVNDDGSIPKDNPFVNTPNALPSIWSYGHRNPQGFAWDPVTRPAVGIGARPDRRRRDQHRRARPQLRLGRGDQGHAAGHHQELRARHGRSDRLLHPDVRARRDFVLHGQSLSRRGRTRACSSAASLVRRCAASRSRDDKVTRQEVIFNQYGRIRDVVQGPDGYLYLAVNHATGAGTNYGLDLAGPRLDRPAGTGAIASRSFAGHH